MGPHGLLFYSNHHGDPDFGWVAPEYLGHFSTVESIYQIVIPFSPPAPFRLANLTQQKTQNLLAILMMDRLCDLYPNLPRTKVRFCILARKFTHIQTRLINEPTWHFSQFYRARMEAVWDVHHFQGLQGEWNHPLWTRFCNLLIEPFSPLCGKCEERHGNGILEAVTKASMSWMHFTRRLKDLFRDGKRELELSY